MIDAGKVRALAIMDTNPPALYPSVPTSGRSSAPIGPSPPGA